MPAPSIQRAAEDVAKQVATAVSTFALGLRDRDYLRALAIVSDDDFSSVILRADSNSHLAKTQGSALDKWLPAQWNYDLTGDVSTKVLEKELGDATKDGPMVQAHWLVAMVEGLKIARARGSLKSGGRSIPAYCSMLDSRHAIWIEWASAQAANSPESFANFKDELAAAGKEWYGEDEESEPSALESAYRALAD